MDRTRIMWSPGVLLINFGESKDERGQEMGERNKCDIKSTLPSAIPSGLRSGLYSRAFVQMRSMSRRKS